VVASGHVVSIVLALAFVNPLYFYLLRDGEVWLHLFALAFTSHVREPGGGGGGAYFYDSYEMHMIGWRP